MVPPLNILSIVVLLIKESKNANYHLNKFLSVCARSSLNWLNSQIISPENTA